MDYKTNNDFIDTEQPLELQWMGLEAKHVETTDVAMLLWSLFNLDIDHVTVSLCAQLEFTDCFQLFSFSV